MSAERFRELAAEVPGVIEGTTRFGSRRNTAWAKGRREIAHLHDERTLDVRVPRARQRELRGDERATFRPRTSDWVELRLGDEADAEFAVSWLRVAAEDAP